MVTRKRIATMKTTRPIHREVLECGGWRGTGLTPLSVGRVGDENQASDCKSGVCPHPSPTAVQDAGAKTA